ncbi:hypothetical protein [Tropicibacter oceani]|uniref:Uncharacterized protein n=1 Tax=Tropicibacter oceani TaxID=3058420 RepID=A0ABY8QMJ5_9RHOB|nr:hypothetical protein [Tropicibacter oceani]WGW05327.1 hypothetical protein QF118_07205 [Tropicibacter oceani]
MRWLDGIAASLILFILLGLLWLNQGVSRTYILSAETLGADITFDGRNTWFLGAATLCKPRQAALRRSPDQTVDAKCDGRIYEETEEPSLTLEWKGGNRISLRHEDDRVLFVISEAVGQYPEGTIIVLPAASLSQLGAMTFAGTMQIGEAMAPGARGILLSGDYTVRESNRLSAWFGRRSDVVRRGTLTYGDTATIVSGARDRQMAQGFGQIILIDGARFQAVFRSAQDDAAIRIDALGVTEAIVKPDFIDTLLASPYLIVIGGIFGVFANLISLSFQFIDRSRRNGEDNA